MTAAATSYRWFLVLVLAALSAGCNTLSKDAAREESFTEASGMKRPAVNGKTLPWGASSRARDIERDLGVQ